MDLTEASWDYTRISDDAAILCRRQDFPRAVNVLQRRTPDHRRWREAFRRVSANAGTALDGARRAWVGGAVRELMSGIAEPWLKRELAVDVHAGAPDFFETQWLPRWTARGLWRAADLEGIPMAYVAQVTALPSGIDAELATARVVNDCRRVAMAHHANVRALSTGIERNRVTESMPADELLVRLQIDAQRDAAERWRALAKRLLAG